MFDQDAQITKLAKLIATRMVLEAGGPVCPDHVFAETKRLFLSMKEEFGADTQDLPVDKWMSQTRHLVEEVTDDTCDSDTCVVCLARKLRGEKPDDYLDAIPDQWMGALKWLIDTLTRIKDKSTASEESRANAIAAGASIAYLAARSFVAEKLAEKLKETRGELQNTKKTLNMILDQKLEE